MDARAIVDTGFLFAVLDVDDDFHEWASHLAQRLRGPWLTAEACVSEVLFMLESTHAARTGVEELFGWLEQRLLLSRHLLPEETRPVRAELLAYSDRWVDFADACIVRLSDLHPTLPVVSVDVRDFSVYFRKRAGRTLFFPERTARRRKR